ncbi:hypothetical protein PG985_000718 [Apiospora marii]|uniref:Uncharacterized protein n=1 Tax=Apiospora marii TaxID=335849 RepID=A0ABR1R4H2_9PEZI
MGCILVNLQVELDLVYRALFWRNLRVDFGQMLKIKTGWSRYDELIAPMPQVHETYGWDLAQPEFNGFLENEDYEKSLL